MGGGEEMSSFCCCFNGALMRDFQANGQNGKGRSQMHDLCQIWGDQVWIQQYNYYQMQSQQQQTSFLTEPKRRPQTSHIARNKTSLREQFSLETHIDPSHKLKALKEELRQLQSQHTSMLVRLNDSRKAIDQQYRSSQKRKVQFLNLFEHRRMKLSEKKLLEQKQSQEERLRGDLRERVRTMKLNAEIRGLLLRGELEEGKTQLCSRNKAQRKKVRQEILARRQQQLQVARKSHSRIKAAQEELQDKMRKIGEVQAAMGKTNYLRKLGAEVGMVEQLDKLLGSVCQQGWCQGCLEDPMYLTQKE